MKNLTGGQLQDISMHVGRGEIVGISGLVGSGQTELLNAIFSARRHQGSRAKNGVLIDGTVSYVSGDRAKEGVFQLWDIFDNILIANLDQVKSGVLLDQKKSEGLAQHWYNKLKFRAEGIHSPIKMCIRDRAKRIMEEHLDRWLMNEQTLRNEYPQYFKS